VVVCRLAVGEERVSPSRAFSCRSRFCCLREWRSQPAWRGLLAILGEEGGREGEAGRDPGIGTALFPFLPSSQYISRGHFVVVSTAWQEGDEVGARL